MKKSRDAYSIHISPFLFNFVLSNANVNSFAFSGFLAAASPRRIALKPIEAAKDALLAERIPLSKVILASDEICFIFENIFAGMSISIVKSFKSRLFTPHKIFLWLTFCITTASFSKSSSLRTSIKTERPKLSAFFAIERIFSELKIRAINKTASAPAL